ncbi:MAG: hypothetical protein DMF29_09070 [Verrucomicrobia bacterium]|nr:MAG: hypothetical protein DMF29_09070 [Verrucomicrobiota bacterium]
MADKELMEMSMFRRILFLALITIAATQSGFAASPSVTAVLSDSQPAVGQMVQLEIKVNGANSANVPETISIDGLEIHQTGTSRQFEMHNFDVTSSVTYNYTVLPLKTGQFKIPPQTVRIGSSSLQTPELHLNVAASSNRSAQPGRRNADSGDLRNIARVELVLPKQTAYIGEAIPAEIRVSILRRNFAGRRSVEPPQLNTQGITMQTLHDPEERIQEIDGQVYYTFSYKTALSAAKAGKFEVGPINVLAVVLVSQPNPSRRIPHDVFDMDNPFEQFFKTQQVNVTLTSKPVELNVKPLPNAPPNFSGAVGNFTMAVDAKPKTVQVGDPITVTSTITGRGNFDRMSGPTLEEERGWHKYPPSSKFKQDDDVGISGEKTFEMVIAPNEKKPAVPPLVFAYFDPSKENYVTLRSDAVPIQVEGGAAPAPSVAAAPVKSATPPATTAVTPASTAKPPDILYQMTDLGRVRSFAPIYARPIFWVAQIVPLILLLGFVGWKIRQAKINNRDAQRAAALQQESNELLRQLRRSEISPQEYFSNALRVVRVKTALAKNMNPNAVDADIAAKAFNLGENERAQLRTLFERSDELRFSGGGNGAGRISNDERDEVSQLLESLRA